MTKRYRYKVLKVAYTALTNDGYDVKGEATFKIFNKSIITEADLNGVRIGIEQLEELKEVLIHNFQFAR